MTPLPDPLHPSSNDPLKPPTPPPLPPNPSGPEESSSNNSLATWGAFLSKGSAVPPSPAQVKQFINGVLKMFDLMIQKQTKEALEALRKLQEKEKDSS